MDFSTTLRHIRIIEEYWQARGHAVSCRMEAMPGKGIIEPHYIVRSDMKNGWPRELADGPPRAYEEKPGEHVWVQVGNRTVNTSV